MAFAVIMITVTLILCLSGIAGISCIRNQDGSRIVNKRIIAGWTLSTIVAIAFWTVELRAIAAGAPITTVFGLVAITCIAYTAAHGVLGKMAADRIRTTAPAYPTSD